jgi:tetratricopeptide (TPR) repeat protein
VVLADHAYNVRTGVTLLAHPRWRCVWFDPIAAVFLHEEVAAAAGLAAVDFAGRHFQGEAAGRPEGLRELLASAKALGNYALRMQLKGRPDAARGLALLGRDHARRARAADPASAEAWAHQALLEWAAEPSLGPDPIPRFRLPLDPVFDLSAARVSYAGRQALARTPDDPLTLNLLSQSFQARGMDEAALPLLDRLAGLGIRSLDQIQEREHAEAVRNLLRARLGPMPPTNAENGSELERAITALLATGRAASAAELIAREFPARARSWTRADGLATLWLHLGEPALARRVWEESVDVDMPRPALRSARVALTYLVQDDFEPARRYYREALAVEPVLFEAHYGLAVLELDAGRAAPARVAARLAVAHAPTDVARAAAQAIIAAVEPYAEGSPQPAR